MIGEIVDGIRFTDDSLIKRYKRVPYVNLGPDDFYSALMIGAVRAMDYIVQGHDSVMGKNVIATQVEGAIAEMMVSNIYGGDVDRGIYKEGDDGVDLVIDGVDVDVKSSTRDRPDLLVKSHKANSEIYILVHLINGDNNGRYKYDEIKGKILGGIIHDSLVDRDAKYYPTNQIQNFVAPWTELKPVEELLNEM